VAVILLHGTTVIARFAAATARAESSTVPQGILAHVSPVYGLAVSIHSMFAGSLNSPSIQTDTSSSAYLHWSAISSNTIARAQ
jgi:hypothetical protein